MLSISPEDSDLLHRFLNSKPDHFGTVFPAIMTLVTALLVGGLSFSVQVWLSRREERRFISQRWWQRKAEAYADIMRCLARMKVTTEESLKAVEDGGDSGDVDDESLKRWTAAKRNLEDMVAQEQFIISAAALVRLKTLRSAMTAHQRAYDNDGPMPALIDESTSLENATRELAVIARKDLGVKEDNG